MALPMVAAFWATLASIAAPLCYRILAALGLGMVSYAGIGELMDMVIDGVQGSINSFPAPILQYVAVFNIDRYFMIVFSAMSVRLVFQGLQATGLVQKMVFRGQLSLPV